jgi:hypothetical protein
MRSMKGIVTKVQFIKTASGEELAILPKSEYERLAKLVDEDVGTARLVHNARDKIAAGLEVLVPKDVVDRLAPAPALFAKRSQVAQEMTRSRRRR